MFQMCRHIPQGYMDCYESGEHDNTKVHNKLSVTDPKEMEIHKLPDKEFKIIVLKKLRKLQKDLDRNFNKIRKTIKEKK